MKRYQIEYSVYDDGTWYSREFRGDTQETAYLRWEQFLELMGQEADVWEDPKEIA
jgi:hypothetical protein